MPENPVFAPGRNASAVATAMSLQRRTTIGIAAAAVAAGGAGLFAGVTLSDPRSGEVPALDAPATSPIVANREVVRAAQLSEAFITIAQAVTPSVVRIEAERTITHPADVWGTRPLRPFGAEAVDTSAWDMLPDLTGGSGFIISRDGYILTNDHVVADADRLTVTLADKRVFTASIVGSDPATDLAVIRIAADGLPVARLGDSDSTRVGEWVLAVGNPGFGDEGTLDFTVTSGIISAKGRPLNLVGGTDFDPDDASLAYTIEDFLQTDAVINPGNSGGPLVNLGGLVIGVNTAIASSSGFSEGYGFAIPANLVRRVARDLIAHGHVRRPVLGVSIIDITAEDAQVYSLRAIAGALIEDFPANSPAAQAGLQRHDVVTALDGRPVERVGQLQRMVAQRDPGETVRLSVTRFGDTLSAVVRLGQAPRPTETPRVREAQSFTDLGLELTNLDAATARQMGFARAGGVVVADVQPFSPSDRKGVAPGDRFVTIGGERPVDADHARALIRAVASGRIASLLMETPAGRTYIANIKVP